MSLILLSAMIGSLGLFFGLVLAFAAKVFHVEIDSRVEQIIEILPGANCGACGMPGCGGYAEALVKKDAPVYLCPPGGKETVEQISQILGKVTTEMQRKVAIISCNSGGFENTKARYLYQGIKNCKAAAMLSCGPNLCNYGCVFQNDCIVACIFGAITLDEKGMRVINNDKCTGCTACIKACPRDLIEMVPDNKYVHILCSSKDKGPVKRKDCGSTPCVACSICVKNCPVNAITVSDYLARLDYDLCNGCGICAIKCPTKAISHLVKKPQTPSDNED